MRVATVLDVRSQEMKQKVVQLLVIAIKHLKCMPKFERR